MINNILDDPRYEHIKLITIRDCINKDNNFLNYDDIKKVDDFSNQKFINIGKHDIIFIDIDLIPDENELAKFLINTFDNKQLIWIKKSCLNPKFNYLKETFKEILYSYCRGVVIFKNNSFSFNELIKTSKNSKKNKKKRVHLI